MRFYQKICYKVEDLFVKALSRKDDKTMIQGKVNNYRNNKEIKKKDKKLTTQN